MTSHAVFVVPVALVALKLTALKMLKRSIVASMFMVLVNTIRFLKLMSTLPYHGPLMNRVGDVPLQYMSCFTMYCTQSGPEAGARYRPVGSTPEYPVAVVADVVVKAMIDCSITSCGSM